MEDDGFVLVKRKCNRRRLNRKPGPQENHTFKTNEGVQDEFDSTECLNVKTRLPKIIEEIRSTSVWQNLKVSLEGQSVTSVVCLGLGSLTNRDTITWSYSRRQLGLLLSIKEHLQLVVRAYDPQFNRTDICILTDFGINCLNDSEAEQYISNIDSKTLLFMPSCPFSLFEFVLKENSEQLDNLIFLGNDLSEYCFQNPEVSVEVYPTLLKLYQEGVFFSCKLDFSLTILADCMYSAALTFCNKIKK